MHRSRVENAPHSQGQRHGDRATSPGSGLLRRPSVERGLALLGLRMSEKLGGWSSVGFARCHHRPAAGGVGDMLSCSLSLPLS